MPHLCWIDCETTGLNAFDDDIVEIALLMTDANGIPITNPEGQDHYHDLLRPYGDRWDRFLARGEKDWAWRAHRGSGLIDEVNQRGRVPRVVFEEAYAFISSFNFIEEEKPLWAGSGCDFDRRMIASYEWQSVGVRIDFTPLLHHRSVEMQTLRHFFEVTVPDLGIHERDDADVPHRALGDLEGQIRMYRRMVEYMKTPQIPKRRGVV